ncbi:MAG: 50S ribosomal protein L7/L12 [Pseudomonadota bacterium]
MSEHLGRDSRDPTTLSSDELPAAVISALRQGNKIEAIKLLRQARGGDLKTSKDTVDAYLRAQPALRERLVTARAEKSRSYLIWVILLLTLSIAAYFFLKGE